VFEALGLLVASLLALLAAEIGAVGYVVVAARAGQAIPTGDAYVTDPTLTLVRICASGVAHIITIALAWWVVTNGGREPFFANLGWGWRRGFGRATVVIAFAGIFLTNIVLHSIFEWLQMNPESTPFDELLKMSATTRIAIGVFAVVSAPFVEEVVFRGVLYPAVARKVGRTAAICLVSGIFLLVHAEQYGGEIAYLLPLGLLSVVLTALRAYSGSLLPSFALHLLFNLVQVVLILAAGGK
jgi:membrane protease YdiL (CAAX protease family)